MRAKFEGRRLMELREAMAEDLLDFNNAPDYGQYITEIDWKNRKVHSLKVTSRSIKRTFFLEQSELRGDEGPFPLQHNESLSSRVHWCRRKTCISCSICHHGCRLSGATGASSLVDTALSHV